jgi:Plasmid pRiA4b ORF-3-like protein
VVPVVDGRIVLFEHSLLHEGRPVEQGTKFVLRNDIVAMGWLGGHLHAYEANGTTYELPDEGSALGHRTVDERKARLNKVLPKVGAKMRFDYDFGDGWSHDIIVEAIEPANSDLEYPRCLTGKRACPPDDCGGPRGYGELLAILTNPSHPEHDERLEWLGGPCNPGSV